MDKKQKDIMMGIAAPIIKMAIQKVLDAYLDDIVEWIIEKIEDSENGFDDLLIEPLKKLKEVL